MGTTFACTITVDDDEVQPATAEIISDTDVQAVTDSYCSLLFEQQRSLVLLAGWERFRRRSSWAFSPTTMVETLISTAPTAGGNVNPARARTPAVSGAAARDVV